VNNTESLVEMIEYGLGYGVLTREFAEAHRKENRLSFLNGGASVESRLALAWYPRPRPSPYFKAIIDAIH
jgi:DNA-binding transcriptional LysR family regulator